MPRTYLERWLLYLDEIDHGSVPSQFSYHCYCDECWEAKYQAGEDDDDVELVAADTAQVRQFIDRHQGHDVTLTMEGGHEFADLDQKARSLLIRQAIFRRHWVATMPDEELRELPQVGPKRLCEIRKQIPYSGPPEKGADAVCTKWERCPMCSGTGLKLSDAALAAAVEGVNELERADAEANPPAPVLSVEESLTRLTTAIEEINARLAALEKDRNEGLSTPRIVMSLYDAAKAIGVRHGVLWDAVLAGELPFVRRVKGCPMICAKALEEWLRTEGEYRYERKWEPLVRVTPPELLCQRCGEREYSNGSAQLKLCRECHQQVKQERIDEKERKRAERTSRKKQ